MKEWEWIYEDFRDAVRHIFIVETLPLHLAGSLASGDKFTFRLLPDVAEFQVGDGPEALKDRVPHEGVDQVDGVEARRLFERMLKRYLGKEQSTPDMVNVTFEYINNYGEIVYVEERGPHAQPIDTDAMTADITTFPHPEAVQVIVKLTPLN